MKENIYTRRGTYSEADDGMGGKAFEASITGRRCKASGKTDWTHLRVRFEVKTGAGELGNLGQRLLKGCKHVLYVPVPVWTEDSRGRLVIDPWKQEGFVLSREAFLEALAEANLIREKTSTAGVRKVTIQTFWNSKQNKPHGRGYERLLDALYSHCEMTLEEFLEAEEERG